MKYFYPLKCSKNCLDSSSLAEKISTFFKRLFLNNSMFSTCNAGKIFDNFLFLTAQRKPCRADFSPGMSFSISFLSHFLTFSLSNIFHSPPSSKSCYSYCVTLCFCIVYVFVYFSVYVGVVRCFSVFVGARFCCVSVFPLFVCVCYRILASMWMCDCK